MKYKKQPNAKLYIQYYLKLNRSNLKFDLTFDLFDLVKFFWGIGPSPPTPVPSLGPIGCRGAKCIAGQTDRYTHTHTEFF